MKPINLRILVSLTHLHPSMIQFHDLCYFIRKPNSVLFEAAAILHATVTRSMLLGCRRWLLHEQTRM
jgi:hypothetical protein